MTPYSDAELACIKDLLGKRVTPSDIADFCNKQFHRSRPIRTPKSIDYSIVGKLKIGKSRFERTCNVCESKFRTSWPQAAYCSDECRAVINREYANNKYRADPLRTLQAQTLRKRQRAEERWRKILDHFGDRCSKCEQTFPRVVYDLHHPNGKESRMDTPSKLIPNCTDARFERLLTEVVLLCANCHRLTHSELGNWGPAR